MAGENIRYQDCKDLGTLTKVLDLQQHRQRVQDFQETNSNIGKGFFFDDQQGIKSLFAERILSQTPLTSGALVYLTRQRNIAKADAFAGIPAMGIIVANIQGEEYLWSMDTTYIFLNVDGTPISGPTMQTIYMGQEGRASFEPPDDDGAVNQKIGQMIYYDDPSGRYYCRVNCTSVFVGL